MRIGIDARAVSNRGKGGLNTYTANLIQGLARVDKDNLYILYTDREFDEHSLVDAPNFSFKIVRPTTRLLRENLTLPYQMWQDRLDVAHFPTNAAPVFYPGRYVITIHDTSTRESQLWRNRDLRTKTKVRYEAYLSQWFVRRASLVMTDSHYSKVTIQQAFHIHSTKVKVAHLAAGIGPVAEPQRWPEQVIPDTLKGNRFILSLGSADPRKNLQGLIKAFAHFWKEYALDYLLVVVTADGASREQLSNSTNGTDYDDRIVILPKVTDVTLRALYQAAELFVCPSLYEGFGIPVLEAMAFGTPVLSSNRTSLPEIVGDAGLLVDPLNVEQIAQQMYRLLTDTELRQMCINRGLQRCRQFSWKETARQTLAVYREALEI